MKYVPTFESFLSESGKTTVTNQQVIDLINRAFDENGQLVDPKSRKNRSQAKAILSSGLNLYGKTVDGFDAHTSLLMIAYPDREI
jgi:hypothetical protein